MPHAYATLRPVVAPSGLDAPPAEPSPRGAERRADPRYTPADLRNRFAARHKYGESVTLVDLSIGGVQFETARVVRPDVDVVLEILDSRTREISHVVSRVLRANVAALNGGIRYRAACAFRRPLSHPTLLVPPAPPARPDGPDYLKLELELKTIVDNYFRRTRTAGAAERRESSSVLQALMHLRTAAERRRDPIDRQLGVLLAAMIPALQRHEPPDAVLRMLHTQLAQQLPLVAIHPSAEGDALSEGHESITLNVSVDASPAPIAITAEFPSGFGLDASQFRLLKVSAYLVGLIESWSAATAKPRTAAPGLRQDEPSTSMTDDAAAADLPLGWHRVVLRYLDGQLLRGYSNDFSADRAYLQFCPSVSCPADERMLVPIGRLKAVFFVRDLLGDRERVDPQTFDHTPRGRRVQVTFHDGEVLTGSTLNYKPNGQGFFILPANSRGNNIRAYVVAAAIKHMRFV